MNYEWYPWYIQKYRAATMHLGLAECGAYRRLIDEYMMTRKPLPDNDAALARIIGVSLDQWMAVASTVRPFFEASNDKLINKTCEEELHAQACQAHATSTKNRAAANSRWAKSRELKAIHALAYQPHASRMPNDATQQSKKEKEEPKQSAASLATALPTGALRSPPCAEIGAKRPSEVSRAELDAIIAARRVNTN